MDTSFRLDFHICKARLIFAKLIKIFILALSIYYYNPKYYI